MSKNKYINRYGQHQIDNSDIKEVVKVLKSDFLTQGPFVEKFEKEFSKYVGSREVVACSSGTAAIHLSLIALGINLLPLILFPLIAKKILFFFILLVSNEIPEKEKFLQFLFML